MKMYTLLLLSMLTLSSYAEEKIQTIFPSTKINHTNGELVVGTPNFNMKRYDDFVKAALATNGIRNIEFCAGMEVFLIEYDTAVFGTSEEVFRALENQLKGFKIFHKLGATHAELKGNC